MMKTYKRTLLVLVLLFAGFCFGAGSATLLVACRLKSVFPMDSANLARVSERFLDRRLGLSKSQRAAIRPVVVDFADDIIELRREVSPRALEMMERAIERMEPHLELEQADKLDQLTERLRRGWESVPPPVE